MELNRILSYLRLGEHAESPELAMEAIERGVVFRGTNMLILVCAIIIASVGLNLNSTAVVIGAMLISPLMGPIMGVGAGLGVLDLWLVRRSLKNLAFAVAISLATSALYFLLSPLSDAHSEILARTNPTIWDVLIALAGGFAGIIATASKEKVRGNVVPGVAIATALMPPLCTAGYGLAHLNWTYLAGALYLFLINSVFISIAALATVRWLGYPQRFVEDQKLTRKIKRYTTWIVLATVLPSIWLAYRLVVQNAFAHKAEGFIAYECTVPENYLLDKKVDPANRTITLTYLGNGITPERRTLMEDRLAAHGIAGAELDISTGLSLQELDTKDREKSEGMQRQIDDQSALVAKLGAMRDSLTQISKGGEALMNEAKAMEPGLSWLVKADLPGTTSKDSIKQLVAAHFVHYPDTATVGRMQRWLNVRLNNKHFVLTITADSDEQGKEGIGGRKRK
ncbi:MAG: TIGR00341 family protein [Flavobacteriales bacterium]|nr:TIGR00341 family protein [Flavobacteriales bacterium]